jgi:hypothetical protein
MNANMSFYPIYEKLLKMRLETRITDTQEFKVLAEQYPYIAESFRLKTEMRRLGERAKSARDMAARIQIREEISRVRAKQRAVNILKQLHGESKQERAYHVRFVVEGSKDRVSSLIMKVYGHLDRVSKNLQKKWCMQAHRNAPPSIFDLRSLDLFEKDSAVRDWIQNRQAQVVTKVKPARSPSVEERR